jgi:putative transposase
MGQATRTTKLFLNLGKRDQAGANTDKQAALTATVEVLNVARAFYINFFLAHADKLAERIPYYSEKHLEMRERVISAHELLTWAEFHTVETKDHPHPWEEWNFSQAFADMPFTYRRSVIKDAIGKVRSFLSHRVHWQKSGKKKGRPVWPGAANHPTLYEGTFSLELDALGQRESFVRLKVYSGQTWMWLNYPVKYSRYFEQSRAGMGAAQPQVGAWQAHGATALLPNQRDQREKGQREQA